MPEPAQKCKVMLDYQAISLNTITTQAKIYPRKTGA